MAGTYSQIYIQIVFAVKGRFNGVKEEWKNDLYSYIGGIIKKKGLHPIIINGTSNHIHIFFELKPALALSDVVRELKNNSTNYINKNFSIGRFSW